MPLSRSNTSRPFLLNLLSTAEITAPGRPWPPGTVIWLKLLARGLLAELPLEPGHPATGVKDLLLAGVEGVAVGANLGVDAAGACRRSRGEGVYARAGHRGHHVVGDNVRLHCEYSFLLAESP